MRMRMFSSDCVHDMKKHITFDYLIQKNLSSALIRKIKFKKKNLINRQLLIPIIEWNS